MLVKRRPRHHLPLDRIVQRWQQFHHQRFENDLRGDAIDEQFVQLLPRGDETLGTLFPRDARGQHGNVAFPIGVRDGCGGLQSFGGIVAGGDVAGFEHEEGAAEIAVGGACDVDGEFVRKRYAFFSGDCFQDS